MCHIMNQVSDNNLKTLPSWLAKIVQRQDILNRQYESAHDKMVEAYNDFLSVIEEINEDYGTEFTFEQAAVEFQGDFAFPISDEPSEDEDDEDDDED